MIPAVSTCHSALPHARLRHCMTGHILLRERLPTCHATSSMHTSCPRMVFRRVLSALSTLKPGMPAMRPTTAKLVALTSTPLRSHSATVWPTLIQARRYVPYPMMHLPNSTMHTTHIPGRWCTWSWGKIQIPWEGFVIFHEYLIASKGQPQSEAGTNSTIPHCMTAASPQIFSFQPVDALVTIVQPALRVWVMSHVLPMAQQLVQPCSIDNNTITPNLVFPFEPSQFLTFSGAGDLSLNYFNKWRIL